MGETPPSIAWIGGLDGHCELIDQTRLPQELVVLEITDVATLRAAICRLSVRGAPAVGAAGALGLVLGVRERAAADEEELSRALAEVRDDLAAARPTAVNLRWALDRCAAAAAARRGSGVESIRRALLDEALRILDEDRETCRAMGRVGAELLQDGDRILTHCNTGALAAVGIGTALAVIFEAHAQGKRISVIADETRPLLQGARLTTWELMRAGIEVTLICDGAAAQVMSAGRVDRVLVGADRIARNGDLANKIGTLGVAILARHHGIPFYGVAPASTFDLETATGADIPIEQRSPDEVRRIRGHLVAPEDVPVHAPAFDVTPAELITGIVTERGLISPVTEADVLATLRG